MDTVGKAFLGIILLSSIAGIIIIGANSLNLMNETKHPQILVDKSKYENAIKDNYSFDTVSLEQNFLSLDISYSGGCASHEFSLIGSGDFMESYPVQTTIVLSHEDNDDNCESFITETLVFDLTPLKELYIDLYSESSGTIIIHLLGWDNSITYEY